MKPIFAIAFTISILLCWNVAVPASAERAVATIEISSIHLGFENQASHCTVPRRQDGLQAFADIEFSGSGLFEGCWLVDDQFFADIAQYMTGPGTIRIASPATPGLPTIAEGLHIVALVVNNTAQRIKPTRISYFVTTDVKSIGPLIALTGPPDSAVVDLSTQSFTWEDNPAVNLYLIEFIDDDPGRPVMSAFTEDRYYRLPVAVTRYKFIPGRTYFWQVKGFSADHKRVYGSFPRQFQMAGGPEFDTQQDY